LVRTFARIQVAIAATADLDKARIPHLAVAGLPALFDTLIEEALDQHAANWAAPGNALVPRFATPADFLRHLVPFRRRVRAWTVELLAGGWPDSIDHDDLQGSNAVVRPDGQTLIYDWDESIISCPFFSLDRLARDTRSFAPCVPPRPAPQRDALPFTPGELALRDAYTEGIPWNTSAARERAFDLAMRLVPIKHAAYDRVLVRARATIDPKWEHWQPASLGIAGALRRWESIRP